MSGGSASSSGDLGLGLLGALMSGRTRLNEEASPLREVLAQMLGIYSAAILVIAGFIVLYYIVLVVVDAAQTGKVFRRINPVWGPLRLVIAIGLLVPMSGGLNSGQLMVMALAKWGSGLASDLWRQVSENPVILRPMLGAPKPVPALALVRALVLRDACIAYTTALARRQTPPAGAQAPVGPNPTRPANALQPVTAGAPQQNPDGTLTIAYGWAERPFYCGAVTVYPAAASVNPPPFDQIKLAHLEALEKLERRTSVYAENYLNLAQGTESRGNLTPQNMAERYQEVLAGISDRPFANALADLLERSQSTLGVWGWVGAPAYLDAVLRLNVRVISLNASLPHVDLPEILLAPPPRPADPATPTPEWQLYQLLLKIDQSWGAAPRISPLSAAGLGGLSEVLGHAVALSREVAGAGATGHQLRAMREFLRLDMAELKSFENPNPLIGLAQLGSYLTGKAVELLAGAGVLASAGPVTGPTVALLSVLGILAFLASIALLLILPILPLVRFLFGIAVWLLEVLEALIAIPLVALTHLRADENGIAGPSAVICYLLVLKIVLRPVLMVFGLLGGLLVFMLMLGVLNQLFGATLPATAESGQLASLWFVMLCLIYAILVLALGNAAFKLIDWLPTRTLDWLQGLMQPGRPSGEAVTTG